jgi:uncharacterized membrane protein
MSVVQFVYMYPHLPYLISIFLSFAGFVLAWSIHYKKRANETLTCPIGNDCTSVIHSSYSKFAGIEVTTLGMVYYGLSAFFYAALIAFPWIQTPHTLFVGFLIALTAVIFSVYLIVVQGFTLKQWCTWCLGSALNTFIIFVIVLMTVYQHIGPILLAHKTIVVILHAFAAGLGVGAVTLTDVFFFKFLKDYRISHSEKNTMNTISDVIWVALILLIVTGIGLYAAQPETLNTSTKFLAKVIIVGVVFLNGILLNLIVSPRLMNISFGIQHVSHPGQLHGLRRLGFALGAVSITSWYSAFILGSVRSLPFTTPQILLGYLCLVAIGVIGSQVMDLVLMKKAAHHIPPAQEPKA